MKQKMVNTAWILSVILLTLRSLQAASTDNSIIQKKTGRIILAYKGFEAFLETEKTWQDFEQQLLIPYPEVQIVHEKQMSWGAIDSLEFPKQIKTYQKDDFAHYFSQYDVAYLSDLYDSIVEKGNRLLPPSKAKPVDLCFFLPYGSCFIDPGKEKATIFISLYINPVDVRKIMSHEYGHYLHMQWRPDEPQTLAREVVSEGVAVYITMLLVDSLQLKQAIPFMPESSVDWCFEHETMLKDSILSDLAMTHDDLYLKYISDGSIAKPPAGFVQKTAYFAGYRIIESCINRGMKLEDICLLDSKSVIDKSGYFINR